MSGTDRGDRTDRVKRTKKPRVTLTRKHNGRFYLGMEEEDMAAVVSMVRLAGDDYTKQGGWSAEQRACYTRIRRVIDQNW